MRYSFAIAIALSVFALVATAPSALADSLDDQLGLTEDRSEAKQPEAPAKPETTEPQGVAEPTASDVFVAAVSEMKQAGGLLDKAQTARQTQRLQENVILRIDQLIADAKKKQCKSCKKPGEGKPGDTGSKPAAGPPKSGPPKPGGTQAAKEAGGPGSVSNRGDTEPLDEQFSEWGKLPERVRTELLQGRDDKFSTLYSKLTARYYKRLAEENE
ncbi:MAG: hypothetical protein H8E63_03965 [Proteobacteria bacterium]|nr:hypothetical protein [Pseudomonadota bacterium]